MSDHIESVQRAALRIIVPGCSYADALVCCGLDSLAQRRDNACRDFISKAKNSGILAPLLPQHTGSRHNYGLRSGNERNDRPVSNTQRLGNFVTYRYPLL